MRVINSLVVFAAIAILSACSSNRFVRIDQAQILHDKKYLGIPSLPDWQNLDYDSLKQACTSIDSLTLPEAAKALSCADNWLTRPELENDDRQLAITLYNSNLSHLVNARLNAPTQTESGDQKLIIELAGDYKKFDQVVVNDQIRLLRDELRFIEKGLIGVPAVGIRINTRKDKDVFYPLEGIFRPLTFILEDISTDKDRLLVKINSVDVQASDTNMQHLNIPIQFSSAAAFLLLIEHANIDDFSWTGLINPRKAESRRGIFAIEELSNSKTPILMTHGLNSDPLIWRNLTLAILNDACLHNHFQIWHSYYPSGPPPFYSSMRLRTKLNDLLSNLDADIKDEGVFIGHSMGGVISKTMVTDSEFALWDATFTSRPENMSVVPSDYIQNIFMFQPAFNNNTVFFLDTPHRGSETARSVIGYLGSALVTLPDTFLDVFRDFIDGIGSNYLTDRMRPFLQDYGPNSVEVLRPGHPLMESLYTLNVQGDAFSVIGSETDTECDSFETCQSVSDGVVDYTSAYLPNVQETIIVQSEHNSFRSDEAILFIINKLKKHNTVDGQCGV